MERVHYKILLVLFLLYGFALTPLGLYKKPVEQVHPGYYSVGKIDPGDDAGYYAYLRSGFIDGDFDFFDEKRYWHFDAVTERGYVANYWPMGAALFWSPFFLAGHGLASFYNAMDYPVPLDGHSFTYQALIFLGSSIEGFVALFLCYALTRRLYSARAALAASVFAFTATCLPYFVFVRNRMSHSTDVLAGLIFFYFYLKYRESKSKPWSFFILWGAIGGLLILVRYINVFYLIIPLWLIVETALDKEASLNKKLAVFGKFFAGGMSLAVVFSPQLAAWNSLHGVFSSLNPHTVVVKLSLFSVLGSYKDFLFGGNQGLFFFEPIWALGLVGLIFIFFRDRRFAGPCLAAAFLFTVAPVVVGHDGSFGQRYLLPALPLLVIGLAEIFERARRFQGIVWIAGAAASAWIFILIAHYKTIFEHTVPDYISQTFKNVPSLFESGELFRPTTLPHYLLTGNYALDDYRDFFFLLIFPTLQILIPIVLTFAFFRLREGTTLLKKMKGYIVLTATVALLAITTAATIFIEFRHPPLSVEVKSERHRISAASKFLKKFPNPKEMYTELKKAERFSGKEDANLAMRGDAFFIRKEFEPARNFYALAVANNPLSYAALQLERTDFLTGRIDLDLSSLLNELKSGKYDDKINRLLGIYYLDALKHPVEAMRYFKSSLETNPEQAHKKGMESALSQYEKQWRRLTMRGQRMDSLPGLYFHMLNTEINRARLNFIQIDQPF
jgi:tetratricopeptide (TPR) repeat protein